MAVLKIVRDSGYADRARAYKIVLDGKPVGKIRNGETREFPVTSGEHDLSLKIDWCGSNVVHFVASERDVFIFDAKSNLRGRRIFGALWHALFAWNSWLLLEPRSESQRHKIALTPSDMPEKRFDAWWFGTASLAMTILWWLAVWFVPAAKVDSALQSIPILNPLLWIILWFLVALGLGIVASARRRLWLPAPCFALATAVRFFYYALQ